MFTTIANEPIFPWTATTGYALFDANAANFGRFPWVTTEAADREGRAYFADIGSMPNLDDPLRQACETPEGTGLDAAARIPVLDGSRGACTLPSSPGAAGAQLLAPSRQPALTRSDYVTYSNDSHWLSNPEQPLEGSHGSSGRSAPSAPRARGSVCASSSSASTAR